MSGSGFQDSRIYKISPLKDRSYVMEVEKGKTDNMVPIIVNRNKNAPNQRFRATNFNAEGFHLTSLIHDGKEDRKSWDFVPPGGLLIQNIQGVGTNQVWEAEELHPNTNVCLIRNVHDGRCLAYKGKGKQIELKAENRGDPYQKWRLEETFL